MDNRLIRNGSIFWRETIIAVTTSKVAEDSMTNDEIRLNPIPEATERPT